MNTFPQHIAEFLSSHTISVLKGSDKRGEMGYLCGCTLISYPGRVARCRSPTKPPWQKSTPFLPPFINQKGVFSWLARDVDAFAKCAGVRWDLKERLRLISLAQWHPYTTSVRVITATVKIHRHFLRAQEQHYPSDGKTPS